MRMMFAFGFGKRASMLMENSNMINNLCVTFPATEYDIRYDMSVAMELLQIHLKHRLQFKGRIAKK